ITTVQALVNKLATIASMWVVALKLGPDEIGMASLTLALGIYLVILPPLTLGDVLVAHQRRFDIVAPAARRIALTIGLATAAMIAIAAPFLAHWYTQYPPGTMMALLWVLALRPVADALCPVALASLRRDFRYGTIALADGSIQLVATIATVVMAVAGASAFSLVVPQVVATFVKALAYWKASTPRTDRTLPIAPWIDRAITRSIWRETLLAGTAQYAHNIVVVLPVVILGYCSTEEETGLYSFAFMLSAQANGLIASQLGTVLQPIFGRLGHDPLRQAQAFLRVLRTIGAVAVPMTLVQAALARPLFELVLEPKWALAIPVFAVLSVLEGFYFATAPTMSLLRAQRRFGTYFGWQVSQLAIAAVAFAMVAGDHGALGVAVASLACWGISLPTAVWLCGRPTQRGVIESIGVFTAPWSAALPVGLGVWWIAGMLSAQGPWGSALALLVMGPVAFLACILLARWTQPAAWADLQPMMGGVLRRLRLARRP
ncbi:MAG: oligosaccharide flippase family protein, partial [Planctomycetes bacterium]|nr:oligosaccharide flippase family protein [Planctomycetota bacterium]